MKLNSSKSIETAETVFRNYGGSWTAARGAARRDKDGVLVIPVSPPAAAKPVEAAKPVAVTQSRRRAAG